MIKLLFFLTIIRFTLQQICNNFCLKCNNPQMFCEQCEEGFDINKQNGKCLSRCRYGQYYNLDLKNCVSVCPDKYYNDDETFTCRQLQTCPYLSEQGVQFFDEFTRSITIQDFVVTSGVNYLNEDFTLKIFNATNGKYLGYMDGHDSEILQLDGVESTNSLLSISENQMIWWNLFYGEKEYMIEFGKVEQQVEQNQKQINQKNAYMYYIDKGMQIYKDENIIILLINPKQFGILYYQKLKNSKNSIKNNQLFQQHFQIFDSSHTSAIKGFFQIQENLIGSFSSQQIITWNIQENKTVSGSVGVCNFEKYFIQRIIKVDEKYHLIQLINYVTLYIYDTELNSCYQTQYDSSLSEQKVIIEDIFIYDSFQKIILIRTKSSIFFYQFDKQVDVINENKPDYQLNEVGHLEIKNTFAKIMTQQKYILVLQSSGILKYFRITNLAVTNSKNEFDFELIGDIDFDFDQQMYITGIHYLQQSLTTILVGKGIICAKFHSDKNDELSDYQIISSLKNISPQLNGHRSQINGIVIDRVFKNRIITYSQDGSFKIWQMQEDLSNIDGYAPLNSQGAYLEKASLLFDQYHPQCDIIESSKCPWGVVSLEQIESNLILTQYTDNFVVLWRYDEDQIQLQFQYSLADESVKLNNYQYNQDLKYLLLCSEQQQVIFDTSSDGEVIFNESNLFHRGYFFKGDKSFDNNYALVQLINLGAKFQFKVYFFDPNSKQFTFQKQNQFKNQFIYSEIFSDNTIICVTANNLYYILRKTPDHINVSMKFPIYYFTRDPIASKTFLLFSNGMVGIGDLTKFQYSNITSSSVTLRSTAISKNPLIFFYFQNNVYYPGYNHVLGVNDKLEVVFYTVFDDTISSISVDSTNSKLYVGFNNGKIYHGSFIKQQIHTKDSIRNLNTPYYSRSLRQLFFLNTTSIIRKDLITNQIVEFNTSGKQAVHKQNLEGYLVDEINNSLITFSKENDSCLYKWVIQNPQQNQKISDQDVRGVSKVFLDLKGDALIGFSENWQDPNDYWFNLIVWQYSTLKKIFTDTSHVLYFENLKKDELPENISIMVYSVKQLIFVQNNQTIVSLNNYFQMFVYHYTTNKTDLIEMKNIVKLFYDDLQNNFYAKIIDNLSQYILIYDIKFNLRSKKADHIYDIRDIIFSEDKVIIYDIQTIIVYNRQNLQLISQFSSVNPKVTSLIISTKLNLAIVWNNFMTDDILFQKIGLYDITSGRSIYELQPQSRTDFGNTNLVYLEESTCQLFYTRTTGLIYSFNVCEFYNSGVLSANMQSITEIQYIPEFNYLLTVNQYQICLSRVESSISTKQKFTSLYSQKNNNYFVNNLSNQTYYIDFDNSVWQLNNKNYNFDYITHLNKILFTKFYNDYFYVLTQDSLSQYNQNFKLVQKKEISLKNLYFSKDFIFFQNQNFVLCKLVIQTFLLDYSFSVYLSTYIQDFYILELYNEVIFYDSSQKVYRYNYITNVKLYDIPAIQPFQKSYYFKSLNMIIHLQKNSDIIFYYNLQPNMKSQDSANVYTFQNTQFQLVNTQNILFDEENFNLIISYVDNTVRVFKVSFKDQIISSISLIQTLPNPSAANTLKLKIRGQNLQLFLPWQIIEYDRKTIALKNNFNNSQLFQSLIDYSFSKDNSNYAFIWQEDSLRIVNFQKQSIIFKFELNYPQLLSEKIEGQDTQFNVELKGISNGAFFRYNFLIPKESSIVNLNASYKECFFSVGDIKQFYNQQNQMSNLISSLNKLSFQIERTLIHISPQLSIYYQEEFNTFNSKVLFDGKQENGEMSSLQILSDTFSPELFKEIQIINYILDITYGQYTTFNKQTKKVTFKDLKFIGQGKNNTLSFQNMDYIIFENVIFDSIDLSNSSILLKMTDSKYIFFKNITFTNIALHQSAKLIQLKNIDRFSIQNVTINGIQLHTIRSNSLIQIGNVKYGTFKNSLFQDIKLIIDPQTTTSHRFLLDLQGNSELNLINLVYQNSNYVSFINSQNSYEDDQKIYFRVRDRLSLSEISVSKIKNLKQSLIFSTGYSLKIQKSNFSDIDCFECEGGVASFNRLKILSITNSIFDTSKARNGGALAIIEGYFNQTIIQNSNFYNNSAQSSGGAIYLKMSDLEFIGNVIEDNTALIGGGIRYIGIQPKFIEKIIKDKEHKNLNQFSNNVATLHSQDFGSYLYSATAISNLKLIEAPLERNLQQEKVEQNKINKQDLVIKVFEIHDFQSGGTIDLSFKVVDIENKPIKFNLNYVYEKMYPEEVIQEIQSVQVKATINSDDIKIYGQYITNYQQYDMADLQFSIKEMQIISMPQTSNSVYLEVPAIKRVLTSNQYFYDGPFYIKLNIFFRKCKQGEIYTASSNLFLCGECKVGTYSLEEPTIGIVQNQKNDSQKINVFEIEKSETQMCNRCPIEAEHCFRNYIQLKEGYWRISNMTDSIIRCSNNPLNCVGDEQKGYCKTGHYGPLCEECDVNGTIWGKKYVTDGKYNCINCTELQTHFKYYLPSTIVGILMVIYMAVSIRIALDISENIIVGYYLRKMNLLSISKSAFMDTTNMNMKAMMSYIQIALLVNTFEIELPDFLKILPEYVGQPINNFMFTLDCFFNEIANEEFPVVYLRTIWSLAMPILYVCGMGIIYFFLILFKLAKHSKQHIISGLVFLIFFFQPSMISNLLKVMSCREIDGKKYILADVTQRCYSQTHVLYIFYICIPGIVMWGILIPLLILRRLYQNRNCLDNALVRIPYGFLYQDYKYGKYYWEFLKSYMKILIVIIRNFYGDPYNNQLVLIMVIMLIYQVALLVMKPYQMRYFQNIERRSMEVLIIIVTMNIFLYNRPSFAQQQLFYIIVLAIHNIYQLFLIWEVVKQKSKIIYSQNKSKINSIIRKYFPWFARLIQMKEHSMRVFKYWKRIRNEITFTKKKKQKLIQQQYAKFYFGEELEQERDKYKKQLPITSSQLSIRADQQSFKSLIMRDHISIILPQGSNNDKFNSFLIKSPNSQNDSLISQRYQNSRNNSLFIDSGAKTSQRNQQDENTSKDRQFDRLFEALMLQQKGQFSSDITVQREDYQEEFDIQKDEKISQNQRQFLIYKNLTKVPTVSVQLSVSENQLKYARFEKESMINIQESLVIKDSSQNLPYKDINMVEPKNSNFEQEKDRFDQQNFYSNYERRKSSLENIDQGQNSPAKYKSQSIVEFNESFSESESNSPRKLINSFQINKHSLINPKNFRNFSNEETNYNSGSDKKNLQSQDNLSQNDDHTNIDNQNKTNFNQSNVYITQANQYTPQKVQLQDKYQSEKFKESVQCNHQIESEDQLASIKQIEYNKSSNQDYQPQIQSYMIDLSQSGQQLFQKLNNMQLNKFAFDEQRISEQNLKAKEQTKLVGQDILKIKQSEMQIQKQTEDKNDQKKQQQQIDNSEENIKQSISSVQEQDDRIQNSQQQQQQQQQTKSKSEITQKNRQIIQNQRQIDVLFNVSEEAHPKSFLKKLAKQVTSEYYNESLFGNQDHLNSSNSIQTYKTENKYDTYSFKNNLASNIVAKNFKTDPDSSFLQHDYNSSKIHEISSDFDGNRIIINFCPQDQKDMIENSIQSQSIKQIKQIQGDRYLQNQFGVNQEVKQ